MWLSNWAFRVVKYGKKVGNMAEKNSTGDNKWVFYTAVNRKGEKIGVGGWIIIKKYLFTGHIQI